MQPGEPGRANATMTEFNAPLVRAKLAYNGMKLRDLARETGLTAKHLGLVLSEKNKPGRLAADRIAAVLDRLEAKSRQLEMELAR